jgi:ribosomal protein S18 acetylase RimI-like enzyme
MLANSAIEVLDWDSAFFGLKVARVRDTRLNPGAAGRIIQECVEESIDCLYFLADSTDAATCREAEAGGFHLVDVRLTLRADRAACQKEPRGSRVRLFNPGDLSTLMNIARTSHRDTRFYYDPGFTQAQCDELYATWIERSCDGFADAVLVAEASGRPAGYVSCRLSGGESRIGLIAVDAASRHCGLGAELVASAMHWSAEHGAECVRVTTQARNVGATRLYERAGFLSDSVQLWYHAWPTSAPRGSNY